MHLYVELYYENNERTIQVMSTNVKSKGKSGVEKSKRSKAEAFIIFFLYLLVRDKLLHCTNWTCTLSSWGSTTAKISIFLVIEASFVAPDQGAFLGNQCAPPASKDAESPSILFHVSWRGYNRVLAIFGFC